MTELENIDASSSKVSIKGTKARKKIALNPHVAKLEVSPTLATNLFVKEQRAKGIDMINFGLGESPFGAPFIVREALEHNSFRTSYLPPTGLEDLKTTVRDFYKHYFQYEFNSDRVIIGPGSKELIFDTMMALDCHWLFIAPSWVSYEAQVKLARRPFSKAHINADGGYRITEKILRKRFIEIDDSLGDKTLTMLINYPNNPTGLTLTKSEVQRIARFARNNEILILSDEIYALMTHKRFEQDHYTFGLEYPEGTIVTGGISKDRSLGGWRVGVAIIPEDQPLLLKAYNAIASETFSSVAEPIQRASLVAYDLNEEVHMHMDYSRQIHEMIGAVLYYRLDKAFSTPAPEGAFYLMPNMNHFRDELAEQEIYTGTELADAIIQKHQVAVIGGSAFGLRSDELAFRLAYIDYSGPAVISAFRNDPDKATADPMQFVEDYCPGIIEGVNRLNNFAHSLV